MVQCAVEGCSSRSDTVSVSSRMKNAVHFHRAPQDPHVRKKWMEAIHKSEVNKSTRVCSLHFKKENYYSTKLGFQKLTKGSVPELKLTKEITKDDTIDSSEDETMTNVQPAEHNICYPSHFRQSSSKERSPEIRTADDDLGSSRVKPKDEIEDVTTDSSEDEEMSDVQPQKQNIYPSNNFQQNSKRNITNNLTESSIIKPGVQKIKIKTPLERKLLKQVRRLQESSKTKMEAIHCLLEQNKRLLERNSFLEKALDNSKKVAENTNNVAEQESIFFNLASVTNVPE